MGVRLHAVTLSNRYCTPRVYEVAVQPMTLGSWFAMLLRAAVQHASVRGTDLYRPTMYPCMYEFVRIIVSIVCGVGASRRLPFL